MLKTRAPLVVAAMTAALVLGACSATDGLLGGATTTSAIPEKPRVDPACVTLASQIDTLRKDGVADRVAEAAKGKSATVNVKRESLGKVAELNKANADFQAKCGTVAPTAINSASTPQAPALAKAVSSAPVATAVKAKTAAVAAPAVPGVTTATAAPLVAKEVAKAIAEPAKTE